MKQIFKFCGKYLNEKRGKLILYILICIFSSMTTVVFPYISGSFIDQLVQATDTSFLGRYIAIFVSFSIVGLVLGYVSNRLYMKLQTQIAFRLNVDAIKHVQNLSPGFTQGQDTAYLNQRINNDSNALIIFCIGVLQQIVINAVMVIAPLALIFSFNAYLGIALIVLNANKYSFVWKKSTTKYETRLLEKLDKITSDISGRYGIPATEAEALLSELETKMTASFIHGRGKRKSPLQRDIETLRAMIARKAKYANRQKTFRERNSFFRTGPDATFMHMKEDHMLNAELKLGYNVQLGVEGEYITGVFLCSGRSGQLTLIPLLENMKKHLGREYKDVTADAGYESGENYT